MKNWYKNLPLNGKIIFIMIFGILIPFLVLGMLVFKNVYNNTLISERKFYSHNLKNAADNVDSMLRVMKVCRFIYDNEEFFKTMASVNCLTAEAVNHDSSINIMLGELRKRKEFTAVFLIFFRMEAK